ncbi:DEAD/DEAH box helicase [Sphingobacterium sp. HJSM2_6]|uniref:DEAD/DEAH box helicase n=1 Tax=Sphingobacterium sp. HJSM2_6 TaxID=3366264 RepID=UPI003BDB39DF
MAIEKLKLSKRLQSNMKELGYFTAKEIQTKILSRIIGGHSVIGIAPEGAGKTTTYVLGVLMRLKYSEDDAPKVLILAPNDDKISEIVDRFITISKNKDLHIMGLKSSGSMEEEIEDLVRGVDIVVATPNRARAVYLKLGLNLNRIQTFIIDDAEEIVKQGMQTNVRELAQSCGDVQYLSFSSVEHEKLHLMIDPFMPFATLVEVEELAEEELDTHELVLYQVPNFTTKINLINSLLHDEDVFDKLVIFVNSKYTSETLLERLQVKNSEASVYLPEPSEETQLHSIQDFKQNPKARVLIIANELSNRIDLSGIPFIFHFELPENKADYINQVLKTSSEEAVAITLSTDLELPELKKVEQKLGKKFSVMPLPENLLIYKPSDNSKDKFELDESRGGAFHKKKESNSKTYNYGSGLKARMTRKNKKR